MDNVRDKTVIITGGARGIGYKFAEVLLLNGAKNVAIIDLPTSNGENAAIALQKKSGTGRVIFVSCDMAKAEDLDGAFVKVIVMFENLDIFINNAATFDEGHNWEETIDIILKTCIRGSHLALNYMRRYNSLKGGVIVNVSSIAGLCVFFPAMPAYTASKYGVLAFSQALAGLRDHTGVRVLTICPDMTSTNLAENESEGVVHFLDAEYPEKSMDWFYIQSVDNVAAALLDLIQKGKNGAIWVSDHDDPPYAVDFPRCLTRSLPV